MDTGNMIRIGMILYGYCNGYFGRDSYESKKIEAYGKDWIVVRAENNILSFATFENFEELQEKVKEWNKITKLNEQIRCDNCGSLCDVEDLEYKICSDCRWAAQEKAEQQENE